VSIAGFPGRPTGQKARVIDPLLVILVPPAFVFGWAMFQMRRASAEQPERVAVKR
jgi:hypothetical protein